MPTECPNCERTFTGSRCPRCDWEPPRAARPERPGSDWPRRCQWNADRVDACLMRPTLWPGWPAGGKAVCGWHHACLSSPRSAAMYDEFERFCADLLAQRYCVVWTHYPPRDLWDWVTGREMPPIEPAPCRVGSCPYALQPPEHVGRRDSLAEIYARIGRNVPERSLTP